MNENDQYLRHRHHHGLTEGSSTPRTRLQPHSSNLQHTGRHQLHSEHPETAQQHGTDLPTATCLGCSEYNSSKRPPLQSSLRWLQLCLLLLFAQDVFCFSLGYPFLPQYLAQHGHGGPGVALAFGSYGVASIVTLLLLLLVQSSSTSGNGVAHQPATKYWLILISTSLAAAAGAVNTFVPESYPILLATKAVQGAASALYFVYTLGLVAIVFPAVYKTQAMAFVSAGLTLGDALGPVAGGMVYQARGLQDALSMQPLASGVALSALLMLVLVWPNRKRPWSLAQHHQHQQQQRIGAKQHHQPEHSRQCQQHCKDVEHAATDLLTPLLQHHHAALSVSVTATTADDSCSAEHRVTCMGVTSRCRAATTPAAAAATESTGAKCSLLQLLSSGGILSLCMLALMCQAARTAIDLLLPTMLQDNVQPGVIGLLFAGEAVGSVITPFCLDWLMHRQSSQRSDKPPPQQGQKRGHESCVGDATAAADTGEARASAVAVTDDARCDQHSAASSAAAHCGQHPRQRVTSTDPTSSSSSSDGNTTMAANRLLFMSAMSMAVCCCLVLTAWELPAAGCSLLRHTSSGSRGGAALKVPTWLCPHAHARQKPPAAAGEAGPGAVAGVAEAGMSSGMHIRNSSSSSSRTYNEWGVGGRPHLVLHESSAAGLQLGLRDSSFFWQLVVFSDSSSSGRGANSSNVAVAGAGDITAEAAAGAVGTAAGAASVTHADLAGFGLLQLLLTGLVLMVLGGCHSSCEALIYTVLTDLVAASRQATDRQATQKAQQAAAPFNATSSAAGEAGRKGNGLEVCHVQCSAACAQHAGRNCSNAVQSQWKCRQGGGCALTTDASCDHFAAQVMCVSCGGSDVRAGVEDDATEVVMVLYVLFWVVGFTVGAGVVGVAGSSLLGQQLLGCGAGLVLGGVAWWSWNKAAAAFSQQ